MVTLRIDSRGNLVETKLQSQVDRTVRRALVKLPRRCGAAIPHVLLWANHGSLDSRTMA